MGHLRSIFDTHGFWKLEFAEIDTKRKGQKKMVDISARVAPDACMRVNHFSWHFTVLYLSSSFEVAVQVYKHWRSQDCSGGGGGGKERKGERVGRFVKILYQNDI